MSIIGIIDVIYNVHHYIIAVWFTVVHVIMTLTFSFFLVILIIDIVDDSTCLTFVIVVVIIILYKFNIRLCSTNLI